MSDNRHPIDLVFWKVRAEEAEGQVQELNAALLRTSNNANTFLARAEKAEAALAELRRRVLAVDHDSPNATEAGDGLADIAREIREGKL